MRQVASDRPRTLRHLKRIPPGIKPKAPGERLPVPTGWRFGRQRAPLGLVEELAAMNCAAHYARRHPGGGPHPAQ